MKSTISKSIRIEYQNDLAIELEYNGCILIDSNCADIELTVSDAIQLANDILKLTNGEEPCQQPPF